VLGDVWAAVQEAGEGVSLLLELQLTLGHLGHYCLIDSVTSMDL